MAAGDHDSIGKHDGTSSTTTKDTSVLQ